MDPAQTVARLRALFLSGQTLPLSHRLGSLRALRDAILRREDALLSALEADLGKPPREAYASEIAVTLAEIDHALRHLRAWMRPRRRRLPAFAWPARADLRRDPLGVVLILSPWNYPLQLALTPLAGALAAGNCAVLKPSELAPHTAAALGALLAVALPQDLVQVVPGDRSTAEALLRERFDHVLFTGSARVGRAVMTAAAAHLTPVTLELGGKCPCIVLADAPPEIAARRIVWGKFLNAGRTCVAPDFVMVERPIHDRLVAALRAEISRARLPHHGRVLNHQHLDRLAAYLADGQVECGGAIDPGRLHLEPTLLTGVPESAPVLREEIFGPILPVLAFDSIEGALDLLRARPAPLALYLFTRDRAARDRVVAGSRSGAVCINDVVIHVAAPDLPFGGVGESGFGAYHGRAGFETFTHPRPVVRRALAPDPGLRDSRSDPPMPILKRILRAMLRG